MNNNEINFRRYPISNVYKDVEWPNGYAERVEHKMTVEFCDKGENDYILIYVDDKETYLICRGFLQCLIDILIPREEDI